MVGRRQVLPSSCILTENALQADPSWLVAVQLYTPESEGLACVSTRMSVPATTYTPLVVLIVDILLELLRWIGIRFVVNLHYLIFSPHISWRQSALNVAVNFKPSVSIWFIVDH